MIIFRGDAESEVGLVRFSLRRLKIGFLPDARHRHLETSADARRVSRIFSNLSAPSTCPISAKWRNSAMIGYIVQIICHGSGGLSAGVLYKPHES